jgi:hypothetical protein
MAEEAQAASKSTIWLRIVGESLVPAEVTRALGAEPTRSWAKGDTVVSKRTRRSRVARIGTWLLTCESREPEDFNGLIRELLQRLTERQDAWDSLAALLDLTLSCSLDAVEENLAFDLSPETLLALARRHIGIRVYCGVVEA